MVVGFGAAGALIGALWDIKKALNDIAEQLRAIRRIYEEKGR